MKDVKTPKEAREVLDAIGQEDEAQGIKQTQFFMSEWEKEQAEEQAKEQRKLAEAKVKGSLAYIKAVASLLETEAKELDIPLEFSWSVSHSPKGIIFNLEDRTGKRWRRAFKPCGDVWVDYFAVVEVLTNADTTVQENKPNSLQEMGFIIP